MRLLAIVALHFTHQVATNDVPRCSPNSSHMFGFNPPQQDMGLGNMRCGGTRGKEVHSRVGKSRTSNHKKTSSQQNRPCLRVAGFQTTRELRRLPEARDVPLKGTKLQ